MSDGGEYRDQHLDPAVAAGYDAAHADRFAADVIAPAVEVLAELADGGPVLEFAIGTGRIALPLTERGVAVSGIDLSEPMVAELRAKPGGADVPVTIGDMTSTVVGEDAFSLVYLVFNTIGNLITQDAQVACFVNAARHLRPGGRFVIETGVPRTPAEVHHVFALDDHHVGIDEYVDPLEQIHVSRHWYVDGDRARHVSGRFRWAWPAELDLMARIAGLDREHRWADWARAPFLADSTAHVSVWRKPSVAAASTT